LEDALETFLADGPEDATYRIYKTRNLLVVRNSIENLRLIEEIIREFDKEPLQILIEARFITIGQEDLLQLGTNIERLRIERDADQRNELNTLDAISRLTAVSADGPSMTLSGILGNHDYQLVLHALERNDSSRTLSAPRITVLNNHTAKIRRGDVRHYYEEYELGTVDEQTPGGGTTQTNRPVPTGDVQELETGITLMVRPSVGNDGKRILLSLVPEISTFVQWEEFVTARLPHTLESKVSTSVVVDSGETVVLGGMLQKTDIDNVKQVPWFGRLPLLGYLFRYNNRTDSPTHLLIFVTARIIGSTGEFIDYQQTDAGARN